MTSAAGNIELSARVVSLSGVSARISVLSEKTRGGDIAVDASERVSIERGATITASAGSGGGNITLRARDSLFPDHGSILAIAGVATSGAGSGAGGNIHIDPELIVLDHGLISANAAIGKGGNIFLRAGNFFTSGSAITATGTTDGTAEIAAPELDLAAGLVILPGALVDTATQLREQCARRLGLDFSSFLVIGRGGVSLAPDDPLPEHRAGIYRRTTR